MLDNVRQYITILSNIWVFLTMCQLRQDRTKIAISMILEITENIGQYLTILGNIRQYWALYMILDDIVQYLNGANNTTSLLAIQARLRCF